MSFLWVLLFRCIFVVGVGVCVSFGLLLILVFVRNYLVRVVCDLVVVLIMALCGFVWMYVQRFRVNYAWCLFDCI